MATIHHTTMDPTKLELISAWLPRQPWYQGAAPELAPAGGFRLDDPAGEVGIELMVVTDEDGAGYFVPLAYRGAPLEEAEDGLLGTSAHGVLGTRWIYDAVHDPVAVAQLLAFLAGQVPAQHQSRSDTLDPSVGRGWSGGHPVAALPLQVTEELSGHSTLAVEVDGAPASLDVVRVLSGTQPGDSVRGSVQVDWRRPDGTSARAVVAVVR